MSPLAAGARVAWIGTGVMGGPMCGHLLDAGYELVLHTRTRARAEALLARGARWAESPAAAAEGADVAASIVGFPDDVRAVHLGSDGTLETLRRGALLIDFTTSEPGLAVELAHAAAERGVDALDAPVSGGDVGARGASLSIMVGGREEAYARALPLLERLGRTLRHQGGPGAGQHTKLVNQILIAHTIQGVSSALLYAQRAGLDPAHVLESVGGGAAASWQLETLGPRMLARDFAPGFFVEHFIKDLRIALRAARELGLSLPGLELGEALYAKLAALGHGRDGTQALLIAREALAEERG